MDLLLLIAVIAIVPAALIYFARQPHREGQEAVGRAEVLRARLQELDEETASGALTPDQKARTAAEVARELIAADGDVTPSSQPASRRPFYVAAIAAPLLSVAIYLGLGEPTRADMPLDARTDVPALVSRAEQHLRSSPEDIQGWLVLAPIYRRAGRLADAERAYRAALANGDTDATVRSSILADLAEVQFAARAEPAAIRATLNEANELDASNEKAQYFQTALDVSGLAPAAEAQRWQALIERHPTSEAGWVRVAQRRIASLEEPNTQAGAKAEPVPAMVEAMVASLTERLKADPNDPDGWALMIRSQTVLNRRDSAEAARQRAATLFPDDVRFAEPGAPTQ